MKVNGVVVEVSIEGDPEVAYLVAEDPEEVVVDPIQPL